MATASDDELEDVQKPPPPKPAKKKMPILRRIPKKKTEADAEDNDLAFFGRAKANHASMLRVEHAKHEEELKRKQKLLEEEENSKKEMKLKKKQEERIKAEKSAERKASKSASLSPGKKRKTPEQSENSEVIVSQDEDEFNSRRTTRSTKKSRPSFSNSDRSDNCVLVGGKSASKSATSKQDIDDIEIVTEQPIDLDPELAARVRARRAALRAKAAPGTTSMSNTSTAGISPSLPEDEPIINILIVSMIPNTKPVVFKRRLGQPLGDVRQAWAKIQGLSNDQKSELILVWRGNLQVYDSSSCKGLKVKVNPTGTVYVDKEEWEKRTITGTHKPGQELDLGVDGQNRAVFEAMFKADFHARRREYERDQLAENDDANSGISGDEALEDADNSNIVTVKLRGKVFEQLSVQIEITSQIKDLVDRLRRERNLATEDITVCFEGDDLDESDTLQDIGIEDEEILDIRVK